MESVYQWISAMIGVALVSAVAEVFVSSRNMKQVLRLITATGMITILVAPLLRPNFSAYASALRETVTFDAWDADAAADQDRMLNRMVIESECSAYILDKGKELNVSVLDAHVTVCWSTEGYWVPDRAQITAENDSQQAALLRDAITTDLGIPPEKQEWSA